MAITKADELENMGRGQRVCALRADLGLDAERLIATSAESGLGILELWKALPARAVPSS